MLNRQRANHLADLQDVITELNRHARTHRGISTPDQRKACEANLDKIKNVLFSLAKSHLSQDETRLVLDLLKLVLCGRSCSETCTVFDVNAVQDLCCLYMVKVLALLSEKASRSGTENADFRSFAVFLCTVLLTSSPALFEALLKDIHDLWMLQDSQLEASNFSNFKQSLAPYAQRMTVPLADAKRISFSACVCELFRAISQIPLARTMTWYMTCVNVLGNHLAHSSVRSQDVLSLAMSYLKTSCKVAQVCAESERMLIPSLLTHFGKGVATTWDEQYSTVLYEVSVAFLFQEEADRTGGTILSGHLSLFKQQLETLAFLRERPDLYNARRLALRILCEIITTTRNNSIVVPLLNPETCAFFNDGKCSFELGQVIANVLALSKVAQDYALTKLAEEFGVGPNLVLSQNTAKRTRRSDNDGDDLFAEQLADFAVDSLTRPLSIAVSIAALTKLVFDSSTAPIQKLFLAKCMERLETALAQGNRFDLVAGAASFRLLKSTYGNDTLRGHTGVDRIHEILFSAPQSSAPPCDMFNLAFDGSLSSVALKAYVEALLDSSSDEKLDRCLLDIAKNAAFVDFFSREALAPLQENATMDAGILERRLSRGIELLSAIFDQLDRPLMFLPYAELMLTSKLVPSLSSTLRVAMVHLVGRILRLRLMDETADNGNLNELIARSLIDLLRDSDAPVRGEAALTIGCLIAPQTLGSKALKSLYGNQVAAHNVEDLMRELQRMLEGEPQGSAVKRSVMIAFGSMASVLRLDSRDCDGLTVGLVQWALHGLSHQWTSSTKLGYLDQVVALEQIRRIAREQDFKLTASRGCGEASRTMFRRVQDELWPKLLKVLIGADDTGDCIRLFVRNVFEDSTKRAVPELLSELFNVVLPGYVIDLDEAFLAKLARLANPDADSTPSNAVQNLLVMNFKSWITAVVELNARLVGAKGENDVVYRERIKRIEKVLEGRQIHLSELFRAGTKSILSKLVLELVIRGSAVPNEMTEKCLAVLCRHVFNKDEYRHVEEGALISMLLRSEFMFVMTLLSEAVQDHMERKTAGEKRHVLYCVARLLQLMGREKKADAFVPKVFPALCLALQDGDTQIAACKALSTLASRLSQDAVPKYFSAFVVSLLPCLDNSEIGGNEVVGRKLDMDMAVATTSSASARSQSTAGSSHLAAIEVIRQLVKREKVSVAVLMEIKELLPLHPSLHDVLEFLEKGLNRTLESRLSVLGSLIERDSDDIRLIALQKLGAILFSHSGELHQNVLAGSPGVVSKLMRTLLNTSRVLGARLDDTSMSPSIRSISLKLCECLGWLGAIDPALLDFDQIVGSSSGDQGEIRTDLDLSNDTFVSVILTRHLVDALNAAPDPTAHMRFGYCIQQLLRFLDFSEEELVHVFGGGNSSGKVLAESQSKLNKMKRASSSPVKRGVLIVDALRPFRKTNYEISELEPVQRQGRGGTCFFGPEVPFVWSLGEWVAYLSGRIRNQGSKEMFAPLQVLKQSDGITRLFLFVLPYAVQEVLCGGDKDDIESIRGEVMGILNEALSNFDTSGDRRMQRKGDLGRVQLSVQAVFLLLDTLSNWTRNIHLSVNESQLQLSIGGKRKIDAYEGAFLNKQPVEQFLSTIPQRFLSKVALKCGSPSRALFYLENYLRTTHSKPKQVGGAIGGPGSGRGDETEVRFARDDIELLHKIYASMDVDPDGFRGIVVLRTRQGGDDLDEPIEPSSADEERPLKRVFRDGAHSQPRLMEQISELESESRWDEALSCYEEALELLHSRGAELDEQQLHEGQLRCLWRAGHLELLVSVCDGKLVRRPSLRPLVRPYAMDALWRLGKWAELHAVIQAGDDATEGALAGEAIRKGAPGGVSGEYTESLSAALLCAMEQRNPTHHVERARLKILELLSAASMESYERAYPLLVRLQVLAELEAGLGVRKGTEETWWQNRLKVTTSASSSLRAELLAVRRAVYRIAAETKTTAHTSSSDVLRLEAQSWLSLAKTSRESGDAAACESALLMLRNNLAATHTRDEQIWAWADSWRARIQRAELLKSRGSLSEALQVLQPESELVHVDRRAPPVLARARAKALLFSTNLLVETGAVQGHAVTERYGKVLEWRPDWEKAEYYQAKYLDYLLQRLFESKDAGKEQKDSLVSRTLEAYSNTIRKGTKHLFEVLPRILTLWYSEAERAWEDAQQQPQQESSNKGSSKKQGKVSTVTSHSNPESNRVVQKLAEELSPALWYSVIPQLVSRLNHPDLKVWEITKRILIRVLACFPSRALWHVMGVYQSKGKSRKAKAEELLKQFIKHGVDSSITSQMWNEEETRHIGMVRAEMAFETDKTRLKELQELLPSKPSRSTPKDQIAQLYVTTSYQVFKALSNLCKTEEQSPDPVKMFKEVAKFNNTNHYGLVLPLQRLLKAASNDQESAPLFHSIEDKIEVMTSKARPKKITIRGTDLGSRFFLCKHEGKGDLRKDSRMMEFNGVVNELFARDVQARRRRLKLRTFAVICLSEDAGLLEWVDNTTVFRTLVTETLSLDQGLAVHTSPARKLFEAMQKDHEGEPEVLVRRYREEIQSLFPPCFHKFFLKRFPEPSSWLQARLEFTRSAAAWSMVGHIVGLGDRHAENLLIDVANGECVHVDFDCLFDKGLTLAKPELVPFRLTPNMVDAFGVSGVEGTFRTTCEISLGVLRDNKAMLLSVLESFVVDPLVEWSGRSSRNESTTDNQLQTPLEVKYRQKRSAQMKFDAIEERLEGIVRDREVLSRQLKTANSAMEKSNQTGALLTRRSLSKVDGTAATGVHDATFELLPVNTKGQVDRLIREAIDETKLCRMFAGWCPYM